MSFIKTPPLFCLHGRRACSLEDVNRRNFLSTAVGALGAALLLKKSQASTVVAKPLPAGPLRGKNQHMAMLDEVSYQGAETGRFSSKVSHNINWDLAVLALYPHVIEVTTPPPNPNNPFSKRLVRRNGIDNEVDTSTPSQEVTKKIYRASLVWSQTRVPWRNGSRPEYTVIKSRWWTNPRKDGRVTREKLLELFTECMQQHVGFNYSFPGNYMQEGTTASDRELWRAACEDHQSALNRTFLVFSEQEREAARKYFRPDLAT